MIDYLRIQKAHEFNVYRKRDLVLVRAKGTRVWDDKGREYIDCVTGMGVASLGHCHDRVAEAISKQSRVLTSCSNFFINDVSSLLYERLTSLAPSGLDRVFFCNSGTESVEAAIKFARFTTRKKDFICAEGGYHGRTLGALSATYRPEYRKDFEPLVPGFKFVPFNDYEAIESSVNSDTAGIILEIVQGEGGVNIGEREYFKSVEKLCDERGIILIIDEVQTGLCRTGKMFGCEHFDLKPDILCLAKSLGGGVPMGATLCNRRIESPVGRHGSTFGGNPLACAASLAVLNTMVDEHLDIQAKEKGDYFYENIYSEIRHEIVELRSLGLLIGIELRQNVKPLIMELQERGILVLSAGPNVIRLLPPITIEYDELDKVIENMISVIKNHSKDI